MSSEWRDIAFGDFVALQRGHDLPDQERRPGTVPILGSFGVTGFHDTVKANGPGVTIGRSGASFGVAAYTDKDYWPLNTALYVTDFKGNDPKFVFYFFREFDFSGYNSGSAQPSLNRNNLYGIPIRVPSPHTQRQVAVFVSALDDRITLLRETNATLEAIAQALFKSWFVDFDPVRAKQEGRAPEGMDEATAALFPDGFEESELGLVPRGWRVGQLGDLARLHKGSVTPLNQPETVFEHYSLPAFDNGQAPVFEVGGKIKSNKTPVPVNAVLLSKLNPHIPRIWLPTNSGPNAVCSTEFLVFVVANGASPEFIFCTFSEGQFQQSLCQLVTGTSNSHQRVKPDGVLAMPAVVPTRDVLGSFGALATPIFDRIGHNRYQAQTLATLRDTLLPRLISGQLRLPAAAAVLEEVAA
jgi:type I restriction enzyme S subunit